MSPLEFYYWPTPNGWKISIFLEETGLPYQVHPVNIAAGDQFAPEFLRISPNNKMPAIVDPAGPGGEPLALFESGAILIYLAEKTGQLLAAEPRQRYQTLQWLMFQMGGVGPMLGQAHHFRQYAPETLPYAVERYTQEATRLYTVLDRQLEQTPFVAGDAYSIADIAIFPWIVPHPNQGQDLADYPHLRRWFTQLQGRDAVQRGLQLLSERRSSGSLDAESRENLFGSRWQR